MNKQIRTSHFWSTPWGFSQSFIIGAGLLMCGFVFQATAGKVNVSMHFPANIMGIGCLIIAIILLQTIYKKSSFSTWFRSVPASIASIANLLFMVMFLGIVPQNEQAHDMFGFLDITRSWAFLLSLLYFLFSLGSIVVYRFSTFSLYNIGFTLNHLGLWILVVAALAGVGDMERLTMYINKERPEWRGIDKNNQIHELKIALKLHDFLLEEFPPKLAFISNRDTQIVQDKKFPLEMVYKGLTFTQYNYKIQVDSVLANAFPVGNTYQSLNMQGATFAAKITVHNIHSKTIIQGWVTANNYFFPPKIILLDSNYSLALLEPEPKKFKSTITAYTASGLKIDTMLEVNKPFTIEGWKVYQLSYNQAMGKWSEYSVVELVRDPWLPIVYIGMYMMIAGAIYIIFTGYIIKKKRKIQ